MFDDVFMGALFLLGLITTIFYKFYPKVRDFIDREESNFRKNLASFTALSMFDLTKKWGSSIPPVQDLEKFTKEMMEKSEEIWEKVRNARKLRDRLDVVVVSFIIGVISFFIVPVVPTQVFAWSIIMIGILATVVGILILFYVVTKLYRK